METVKGECGFARRFRLLGAAAARSEQPDWNYLVTMPGDALPDILVSADRLKQPEINSTHTLMLVHLMDGPWTVERMAAALRDDTSVPCQRSSSVIVHFGPFTDQQAGWFLTLVVQRLVEGKLPLHPVETPGAAKEWASVLSECRQNAVTFIPAHN
jgi:hypothetical protein